MLNWIDNNLWIISVILLVSSIYSFVRGYLNWKSGSGTYVGNPAKWVWSKERIPYFKVGATVFGIILLLAAIGSYIWMQLEK